ncbi:MAG TPA: TolC family protein [Terriglobales bacterium]|nr:TolC family protein [Terriglobales bacterium]
MKNRRHIVLAAASLVLCGGAAAQQAVVSGKPNRSAAELAAIAAGTPIQAAPSDSQAPIVITLQDALKRARNLDTTYRTALTAAGVAREDHVQSRAALLPSLAYNNQYLYTQGTGLPTTLTADTRYIANNGVHEYISQGNVHEVISGAQFADFNRTAAAAAAARANAEVAARGLVTTVVKTYYAEVVARRKYANAQLAADEAKRFFELTQKLEQGGEVAHSDVIKAQLTANDAQRTLRDAQLAMDSTHLDLAVLVFPNFNQNFSTVDDLRLPPPLPPMQEIEQQAKTKNPQLYAAMQGARAAGLEVLAAKAAYLPALTLDYFYGIDANRFALHTPTPEGRIPNLGYSASATLNIPIWNWGAIQSKVRQSELRQQQAQIELSAAQRKLIADLKSFYAEAEGAKMQLDVLQQSADLAAESARLTNLRYRAGEATALEVVDAQNSLVTARNNYDDGEARYRLAIANLQTLTGVF